MALLVATGCGRMGYEAEATDASQSDAVDQTLDFDAADGDASILKTKDASLVPKDASLLPASCSDGELSPGETDVDCGGSCPDCEIGGACEINFDCASGACVGGICSGFGSSCGDVSCGAGRSCCNPSCGTCVALGDSCTQVECPPDS